MKLQMVVDAGDILHFLKANGIPWNDGCTMMSENEIHEGTYYTDAFAVGLSWRTDQKFCDLMLAFMEKHNLTEFYFKGKGH